MQTEKDSGVQVDRRSYVLTDAEKYKMLVEIYRLAKAISRRVDQPIVFIKVES